MGAVGTLPEVLGPGDLPKLNEGLRRLFQALRQAQAVFSDGGGGSQLDGAYFSLHAVCFFLGLFRVTGFEGLAMPLFALESALWALDEGNTEPLLKPVSRAKGGRPRASYPRQQFIGMVAYTVRRLRDFGYRHSNAHTEVATELRRVGATTDRGSDRITARTVRHWCDQVSEDVGRRSPAAQQYDVLLTDPRNAAFDRMQAEAAVRVLRQRLVHTALASGVASPPRKTS